VLCLDGIDVFDLGVALETFTHARGEDSEPLYDIEVCAPEPAGSIPRMGLGSMASPGSRRSGAPQPSSFPAT
jgi:hypothetical protein